MGKRVLIDIQGVQTPNAANRGIGRYSEGFLRAMIDRNSDFEYIFLINEFYLSPNLELIINELSMKANITKRYWRPLPKTGFLHGNIFARSHSIQIYEAVIRSLQPEIVFSLSAFEGLTDDAIFKVVDEIPTFAIFYDAIPYVFKEKYLSNRQVLNWYLGTVNEIKKCHKLFSISESSTSDAVKFLNLDLSKLQTLATGLDDRFIWNDNRTATRVMETGFILAVLGEDSRKNKQGLLDSFNLLVKKHGITQKLKIVYKQSLHEIETNSQILKKMNLEGSVEFLGFVPDQKLIELYASCDLFVFPSLYEGLGLPVLEAFACGAVVVCSNTSSMAEILPDYRFTFNPEIPEEITEVILRVLTDGALREINRELGRSMAEKFHWSHSESLIQRAISEEISQLGEVEAKSKNRNLILVTPLPKAETGIADYSMEIIKEISNYVSLTVVTDVSSLDPETANFLSTQNVNVLDVLDEEEIRNLDGEFLYNFGNSSFHTSDLEIFRRYPGFVILHDYFLSGLIWSKYSESVDVASFYGELYRIQGISPFIKRGEIDAVHLAINNQSMNRFIIENALGVIVHSKHSLNLILNDYFLYEKEILISVPHLRKVESPKPYPLAVDRSDREILFVVFGIVADNKCYKEILKSWVEINRNRDCRLVFVGEDLTSDSTILARELDVFDSVKFAGRVSRDVYESYLAQADIAIQLRKNSRGETSGAILDVLAYGIPTITNAHGSNSEYPDEVLLKIQNDFACEDLIDAAKSLINNSKLRSDLSANAIRYVQVNHDPKSCAKDIIEYVFSSKRSSPMKEFQSFLTLAGSMGVDQRKLIELRHSYAESLPRFMARKRIVVDLTPCFLVDIQERDVQSLREILIQTSTRYPNFMLQLVLFDFDRQEFLDSINLAKLISGINIQGADRLINLQESDFLLCSIPAEIFVFRTTRVIQIDSENGVDGYLNNLRIALQELPCGR